MTTAQSADTPTTNADANPAATHGPHTSKNTDKKTKPDSENKYAPETAPTPN